MTEIERLLRQGVRLVTKNKRYELFVGEDLRFWVADLFDVSIGFMVADSLEVALSDFRQKGGLVE